MMGAGGAAAQVGARKASANDRIRIAVLGVNGRGKDHIKGFQSQPDAEVALLCDPDRNVADERALKFFDAYNKPVKVVQDLRRVFDSKEIDAVSIATPNHWHALATIWACQAGKDVYVEKPGAHNIWEGRRMVEAAHKYNRIVQHGVQLRSSEALQEGVDVLRKGVIGRVYMARGVVYRWRPSIGRKALKRRRLGSIMICGRVRRRSGPIRATRSRATGTGIGITAMATSATRGFTRPICACGGWGSGCRRG